MFAAATGVAGYIGYLLMFTGFHAYDDEGFMLLSLRSFISGHALYDQIVVQYGPFYYEVFGLLGALGVSFDNDSGRLVTLAVWLTIALVAGVSVFIFTRNLALGLGTQLITFALTESLTNEPMHPGGLVLLLVVGITAVALISAGRWSGRGPFLVTGALASAAILTKVNVGGFTAISIAFACVLTFPTLAGNWPIRLITASGFVVVPFLLMRGDLNQGWVQLYAAHVALCSLALVVVSSASRPDPSRRMSELGWLLAGGAGLAAVVIALILVNGTSPSGLLQGMILLPLDQRQAYEIALPSPTLQWGFLGVGGALLWTLYRLLAREPAPVIEGAIRVIAGLAIWITLLRGLHIPGLFDVTALSDGIVLPAALAWVAAAPRGGPDGFGTLDFARALVPAVAVLQTLQAYPVAGSQVTFSTLVFVAVGAICISDGSVQLGLSGVKLQLATALVFLTLSVSWLPSTWRHSRAAYAADVSLGLPGGQRIHVSRAQAEVLTQVTQSIRDNCDTFVSLPGLDSFYTFAQKPPPSPLPTRFMWLIDDFSHQRALIAAGERINRLCSVANDGLLAAWTEGRPVGGPLADYLQAGFVPVYSLDGYTVLIRRS